MKYGEDRKEKEELLEEPDLTESRRERATTGEKKARKRPGAGAFVLCALGCAALVLGVIYLVLFLRKENEEKNEPVIAEADNVPLTFTREELDLMIAKAVEEAKAEESERILGELKENFARGDATTVALRSFYPDEIVLASDGKIRFYPILDTVRKNSYQQENLVMLEDGELQYEENGRVVTHKGIDVSTHQGQIDWKQVAEDGVEFAFLRAAYRGYGQEGRIVEDEMFEDNIKGAIGNGIKVGVYFFSQAVTEEEAVEEANVILGQIAPYKIAGPVVFDLEKILDPEARTAGLTPQERTALAIAFCNTVEEAGYRPMIYLNMEAAFALYDITRLEAYDKWFAHYTTDLYYPYEYKVWQYSDHGSVKGIDADVDLNISFEEW